MPFKLSSNIRKERKVKNLKVFLCDLKTLRSLRLKKLK